MTRKLKLQVQMSIDGYICGPNDELDFMVWNWDDQLKQYVTNLTEPVDCIVLGRKLAQGFIPHWAGVAADPGHPEHSAGIKFTDTPKVVFSQMLEKSDWANTALAKSSLVEEITRIKNQPGKDIIAYGGATFVSGLVKHNLIDEYHLFINPAAIGNGRSIFNTLNQRRNLTLVKAIAFPCGIVVLNYAPNQSENRES
ncbi:MAG: deaminase [Chloroflexi bacterium HGW-Chloroflexi-6]|nr:MAG: deaminase [Chloroflexi bacterium HGW-Chloroflexi-6]